MVRCTDMNYHITASIELVQKSSSNYQFYRKMVGNKSSCCLFKIFFFLVLLFADVIAGLPKVYNYGTFSWHKGGALWVISILHKLGFFAIRISWKNKLFLVVCLRRLFKVNNLLLKFQELALHNHVKGAEWRFVLLLDNPVLTPSPSWCWWVCK